MNSPAIQKAPVSERAAPNMCEYAQVCAEFSWERARGELHGLLKAREIGLPEGDTSTLETDIPSGHQVPGPVTETTPY